MNSFSSIHWPKAGGTIVLRVAMEVQGIHVAEHVVLTASTAAWGEAAGLSTFFGLVSGPVMTSYRVWFHFLINLVATWFAHEP